MRDKLIKLLGGQCRACGYSDCQPALQIHGPDTAERRKGKNRYQYYWELLTHIEEDTEATPYYLLCANCSIKQRVQQSQPLLASVTPTAKAVWAYCADYIDVANRKLPAVEAKVEQGDIVYFIDLQTNRVYTYPPPTHEVADDWDIFAEDNGFKKQLWFGLQIVKQTNTLETGQ